MMCIMHDHTDEKQQIAENIQKLLGELKDTLTTSSFLHELRSTLKWQDILDLFDQKVELIDRESHRLNAHALPVLMVPGFSGNAEVVREHAAALAGRGRRTLCVNAPHGIAIEHHWHGHVLPFPQLRKAVALLGTLQKKKLSRVDAIGYSEASITIAIAARLQPEKFRTIVLMNPAGMIGNDSVLRLLLRFFFDKLHEMGEEISRNFREKRSAREKMKAAFRILREKTWCVLSDPLESTREIRAISRTQIHEWLRELQEQHGIKVAIVQSAGDRVFPRAKMDAFIEAAHIPEHHLFYELQGTHDVVLANPKHAMEMADRALSVLEME